MRDKPRVVIFIIISLLDFHPVFTALLIYRYEQEQSIPRKCDETFTENEPRNIKALPNGGACSIMRLIMEDWKAYFTEKRADAKAWSLRGALGEMLSKENAEGVSLGDELMAAYVQDRLDHPERLSLKELSAALGEAKQSVDVTTDGEPLDFFAPPKEGE